MKKHIALVLMGLLMVTLNCEAEEGVAKTKARIIHNRQNFKGTIFMRNGVLVLQTAKSLFGLESNITHEMIGKNVLVSAEMEETTPYPLLRNVIMVEAGVDRVALQGEPDRFNPHYSIENYTALKSKKYPEQESPLRNGM